MKFGLALAQANPAAHLEIAQAAEASGYESVWASEHLVLPVDMAGSPHPGSEAPPIPPSVPIHDPFAWLSFLAAHTERLRLGLNVYLLGIRHPFSAARAVATLDHVSRGRAEIGIGAGWLREEWTAAGLDPATRGRRLDEALLVCKRLWSEPTVEHHGEFFAFDEVAFEPKPVQRPWPRIHVGGESDAALRRAVLHGGGWLGLSHTPESAAAVLARLQAIREDHELERDAFEVTVQAPAPDAAAIAAFERLGVDRLIVHPWSRSREAVAALRDYASSLELAAR